MYKTSSFQCLPESSALLLRSGQGGQQRLDIRVIQRKEKIIMTTITANEVEIESMHQQCAFGLWTVLQVRFEYRPQVCQYLSSKKYALILASHEQRLALETNHVRREEQAQAAR